jgi:Sec7-like guanine-nucleotide exchange factor
MQIDRVMDAFAAHYCAQNPYLFQGMDITFTIWYQSTQLILGVYEI